MIGHSGYQQFKIQKVNGQVKMFLKKDELESNWLFPTGVQLLKEFSSSLSLSVAPFRENTDYGTIFESISNRYFPSLSNRFDEREVDHIKNNWDEHINFLIDLDSEKYDALNLENLKTESQEDYGIPSVIHDLNSVGQKEINLKATFFDVEQSEGIAKELERDDSVVVYTNTISSRPWVGLFIQHLAGGMLEIQWLKKLRATFVLHLNADGSAYTSQIPSDALMYSNILENVCPQLKREGPYRLTKAMRQQICDAYRERDLSVS